MFSNDSIFFSNCRICNISSSYPTLISLSLSAFLCDCCSKEGEDAEGVDTVKVDTEADGFSRVVTDDREKDEKDEREERVEEVSGKNVFELQNVSVPSLKKAVLKDDKMILMVEHSPFKKSSSISIS